MTLQQAQRKAARLILAGKTTASIARHLHLSNRMIQTWKSDPQFTDMMASMEAILNEIAEYKMRTLRRKAVAILDRALESPNPKEYQWAINKILDLPIDMTNQPMNQPETLASMMLQEGTLESLDSSESRQALMSFLSKTRQGEAPAVQVH